MKKILFEQKLLLIALLLIVNTIIYSPIKTYLAKRRLQEYIKNFNSLISYYEGQWDITNYQNNTNFPNYLPTYIITREGFVIDRKNAIEGFLDISDYRFSSSFKIPQTITTPVGSTWRMLSKEIYNRNSEIIGTLTVGYLNPEFFSQEEIDFKLKTTAESINEKVTTDNNVIILDKVNFNNIDKRLSIEIISNDNKLIYSRGSIPSYIDRSYVVNFRDNTLLKFNNYYIFGSPIIQESNEIGLIAVGVPVKEFNEINLWIIILNIAVILPLIFLFGHTTDNKRKLSIDTERGILHFENKEIEIPLDSNQYDLLKILFTKPKKTWNYDEIAERMYGIDDFTEIKNKWRSIYDAARAINKRFSEISKRDLIITKSKTYRINPELEILSDSN